MNSNLKKELGRYFIDVSKLIIGGVVLSSVIDIGQIPRAWLLIMGFGIALLLAFFGLLLLNEKPES